MESRRKFLKLATGFIATGVFFSEIFTQTALAKSWPLDFVDWLFVLNTNAVIDDRTQSVLIPVRSSISGRDGLLVFENANFSQPRKLIDIGFLPPISAILGLGNGSFALGGTQIRRRASAIEITGNPPFDAVSQIREIIEMGLLTQHTISTIDEPSTWIVHGSIEDFSFGAAHSYSEIESTFLLGVSRSMECPGFIGLRRNDYASGISNELRFINAPANVEPFGELIGEGGRLSVLGTTRNQRLSVSGPIVSEFFVKHDANWTKISEHSVGNGFLVDIFGSPYFASISNDNSAVELHSLEVDAKGFLFQLDTPCESLLPVAGREDLAVIIYKNGSIRMTAFETGGKK